MGKFVYSSDQKQGNNLIHYEDDQQWVEKVTQSGQLFWCQGPVQSMWEHLCIMAKNNVKNHFSETSGKLGVAIAVAQERVSTPFTLPPIFSITENGGILGTGVSRLTAELMCGTPREEIVMLCFVQNPDRAKLSFDTVEEINSTDDFEERFKLNRVDYQIVWEPHQEAGCYFVNTIVSHSVYDVYQETGKYFLGINGERLDFLRRFIRETEKIHVNIFCCQDQVKFFSYSKEIFNVDFFHQPAEEWGFSYGRLMGEFRHNLDDREPKLNIWAFDITETVDLQILLMWASRQHYAYYTKNRKLVVFDPSNVSSIKEIPNLIK